MPVVIAEAVAPMASWRPPEALTFHPTLPLPPYTTQVGILAAALGLRLADGYRYVADGGLRLGVGGWHGGHARDLWKYQKFADKEVRTDIVLREHWVDTRLALLVETPDSHSAEVVAAAYRHPAFPLTAGVSDALMLAVNIRIEEITPQPARRLLHTLVYGEIHPAYRVDPSTLENAPLMRSIRAPSLERLPTGFSFGDNGARELSGRAIVTFIADPIELADEDTSVDAYSVRPQSEALAAEWSQWEGCEWSIPVHRYE